MILRHKFGTLSLLVTAVCATGLFLVSTDLEAKPQANSQGRPVGDVQITSPGPKIRLYLMWGQSHMGGAELSTGKISDLSAPVPAWGQLDINGNYQSIPNCYAYDKGLRSNPLDPTTVDTHPGHVGEVASLQDLTVGYFWLGTSTVNPNNSHQHLSNNYPWLPDHQVPDPVVGPDTAFAQRIQEATGDIVVIVKMVVSGANVVNRDVVVPGPPGCNWASRSIGPSYHSRSIRTDGFYRIMLDHYWQEAIDLAYQLPEHTQDGLPVVFGGVVSLIGTSDSRCVYVEDFRVHYYHTIVDLRADVGVQDPSIAPYLVVQSPLSAGSRVRDVARNMPTLIGQGVGTLDSALFLPAIGHATADGTSAMGRAMADWFLGLNLPLQELP